MKKKYKNNLKTLNCFKRYKYRKNYHLVLTPVDLFYKDGMKILNHLKAFINLEELDHRYLNFFAELKYNILLVFYNKDSKIAWFVFRIKKTKIPILYWVYWKNKTKYVYQNIFVVKPLLDIEKVIIDSGYDLESLKEYKWTNNWYIDINNFKKIEKERKEEEMKNQVEIKIDDQNANSNEIENNNITDINYEFNQDDKELQEITNQIKKDLNNFENIGSENDDLTQEVIIKNNKVENNKNVNNKNDELALLTEEIELLKSELKKLDEKVKFMEENKTSEIENKNNDIK